MDLLALHATAIPDGEGLFERFLRDDAAAVEQVYRLARNVAVFDWHFGDAQAEDVAGDAVMSLLIEIGKPGFRIKDSLAALVRTIAWRRCRDIKKKRDRECLVEPGDLETAPSDLQDFAHSIGVEDRQRAELLVGTLKAMSRICQRILVGRFAHGLSFKILGARLGTSESGARANAHRCLGIMRKLIGPRLDEEGLDWRDLVS